ncbi:hypothetical protein GGX14DRAFT_594308 [Mycena pura]|uniref:Uncharacterized protein n=1 Tax=Mycena pura TaxID=153505 RepID=A0AAD6UTX6_9AGAR|nr:hypothetical protein GGX14DRAFT_594308 [Mycena pura]
MRVEHNIKISNRTTLEKLYVYDINDPIVEFPETSAAGSIGHFFPFKPGTTHFHPARNFVYSQGEPRGTTGKRATYCDLFVDSDGNKIPCKVSSSTCQGVKVCPQADLHELSRPHVIASRDAITARLELEQGQRQRLLIRLPCAWLVIGDLTCDRNALCPRLICTASDASGSSTLLQMQPPLSQCDDTHGAALAPPTADRRPPLGALARTGQDSLFQTRWLRRTGTGILSARTLHHTPLMLVRARAHHTLFLSPALARKPHTLKFVCHTRAEPPQLPPPPPILKMPSPHTAPRHRAAAALLAALSMTRLACHAVPPVAHPPLESAHMLAGWLLDSLINFPSTIRRT